MKRKTSGNKSRREFLITAAGTAALGLTGRAQAAGKTDKAGKPATSDSKETGLPRRVLGKTGVEVSLLGFGGGSRFLLASDEDAVAMLDRAVAAGITYFDTASSYGRDRRSERIFGMALPKHRASIFIATKTDDRTYDGAMRSIEESLKLMKIDSLDLIQVHSAGPRDDLSAWDKPTGVLTAFRKLKEQKVTRFIGFTGHEEAEVHKKVIETFDFDTVLMALNAARHKRFTELALPAAVDKKIGIIAMKVARDLAGSGPGRADIRDLLSHTWDLPVATAIIGMESLEQLDTNVRLAREFKPGASGTAATAARLAVEVTSTQLSWAQPGYEDRTA
jgi:uncharacterized protein